MTRTKDLNARVDVHKKVTGQHFSSIMIKNVLAQQAVVVLGSNLIQTTTVTELYSPLNNQIKISIMK